MILQKLLRLYRGSAAPVLVVPARTHFACGHEGGLPFEIAVLGVNCQLTASKMCAACAERYLNKNSTLCARCRRPIFPGHGICCDGDSQFPYTHAGYCGDAPGYCGRWGEGRAVRFDDPKYWPLEDGGEVRPEVYN